MFSTQFIKGITIDWGKTDPGSYLHSISAICGIDSMEFRSPVTFFAGENGTGKSTLLEAIAVAYGFNPEAALSPQRQLTLLTEIHRCARGGAQFFIVAHSPVLLGLPDAEILSFDGGVIHPCPHEETDSFRITSMFINHREMMLTQLLES